MKALTASWRTTAGGVVAGAVMLLQQGQAYLDANPETLVDWNVVAAAIGIIWMAVAARDNVVSSQRAGAS